MFTVKSVGKIESMKACIGFNNMSVLTGRAPSGGQEGLSFNVFFFNVFLEFFGEIKILMSLEVGVEPEPAQGPDGQDPGP